MLELMVWRFDAEPSDAVSSRLETAVSSAPNDHVASLNSAARFDAVAIALEVRDGVEMLLAARPDDEQLRERVRESLAEASSMLDGVEGGDALIEALSPRVELSVESHQIPAEAQQLATS
jgi:hypothetical protein